MLTTEAQAHERNYEKLALFGREDTKLRGGSVRIGGVGLVRGGGGVAEKKKKKRFLVSIISVW